MRRQQPDNVDDDDGPMLTSRGFSGAKRGPQKVCTFRLAGLQATARHHFRVESPPPPPLPPRRLSVLASAPHPHRLPQQSLPVSEQLQLQESRQKAKLPKSPTPCFDGRWCMKGTGATIIVKPEIIRHTHKHAHAHTCRMHPEYTNIRRANGPVAC